MLQVYNIKLEEEQNEGIFDSVLQHSQFSKECSVLDKAMKAYFKLMF